MIVYDYYVGDITFKVVVDLSRAYAKGGMAIRLLDAKDGSPVATGTVYISEFHLPVGHVLVKGWSENADMLRFLVENGFVENTGRTVKTGFREANLCKLLEKKS